VYIKDLSSDTLAFNHIMHYAG